MDNRKWMLMQPALNRFATRVNIRNEDKMPSKETDDRIEKLEKALAKIARLDPDRLYAVGSAEAVDIAKEAIRQPVVKQMEMIAGFGIVRWEYEDRLNEAVGREIVNGEYDLLYPHSEVVEGVRMYPYIEVEGKRHFLSDSPA